MSILSLADPVFVPYDSLVTTVGGSAPGMTGRGLVGVVVGLLAPPVIGKLVFGKTGRKVGLLFSAGYFAWGYSRYS